MHVITKCDRSVRDDDKVPSRMMEIEDGFVDREIGKSMKEPRWVQGILENEANATLH